MVTLNSAQIISLIMTLAPAYNIDPHLAVAVATVESRLNPKAVGGVGEIGLFQLKPASVPHYSKPDLFNPVLNITAGLEYLKYSKERCHTRENFTWLICYNAGVKGAKKIKDPTQFDYYKKVTKTKRELKKVI